DRPVDRQLAERPAGEADRLDDEAVGRQRDVADEARVAELLQRAVAERRDEHALDQALRRLAAGAVRHRDLRVAELRPLAPRDLDDPEDPLLTIGDRRPAHTTSRSRAKRP